MSLSLLPENDPLLRQVAEPVTEFNDELVTLCIELACMMNESKGIGLAAPQVGISKRIIIARLDGMDMELINPEILKVSGEIKSEEGCLTFPGLFFEVKRFQTVTVRYLDSSKCTHEQTFFKRSAVIVQHEIDHLDGKLFIDRISPMQLALARKKLNEKNRR